MKSIAIRIIALLIALALVLPIVPVLTNGIEHVSPNEVVARALYLFLMGVFVLAGAVLVRVK